MISVHALQFRRWGDEYVVYNSLSGDTHLLSSTAAHALIELQRAPADAAILAEMLSPMLQTELNEELTLDIEQLLAELNSLALIEPA